MKDLASLNRDLRQTIIVDNSPSSYILQPENAIDVTSFIDDTEDRELITIQQFLEKIQHVDDVRSHLKHWRLGGAYLPGPQDLPDPAGEPRPASLVSH